MGGDFGPRIALESAQRILQSFSDVEVRLFYHEPSCPLSFSDSRLIPVPCNDYIAANEVVSRGLLRRSDSSLYRALLSVAEGGADVAVTCGNTGVMVAMARHLLGLLRPKLYPALIRELHSAPLRCLVDLGANVHCTPAMLQGFAQLGAAYVEGVGNQQANVGLLNVGVEVSKGSSVIRQADSLLGKAGWPKYSGYAEGYELFQGDKSVIVCDGMVGNAVLKASEGLLSFLYDKLSKEPAASGLLKTFYQNERRHGACLVGVRGNLVKGHGGSDVPAMVGAIQYGIDIARFKLSESIEARLERNGI